MKNLENQKSENHKMRKWANEKIRKSETSENQQMRKSEYEKMRNWENQKIRT